MRDSQMPLRAAVAYSEKSSSESEPLLSPKASETIE